MLFVLLQNSHWVIWYIYIYYLIVFVWSSNISHESQLGKWELLDVLNIDMKFCHKFPLGKWLIILNGLTLGMFFPMPNGGYVLVNLLRFEVVDGTNYVD